MTALAVTLTTPTLVGYVQILDTCTANNRCEIDAPSTDLSAYTLRGFDPGCERQEANRVLEYLRANGPMMSSDPIRKAHLTRELRDVLVKLLADQDLIQIDGKIIQARSYNEFVEALYAARSS